MVKCLPTMWESWVWSLGREDPLEKEMATHSSTLAWKIPWTEECGRLQSMRSQRVGHDWTNSLSLFCDPMDCSLSGSPFPGTLRARTLEWVAISFSNASKWKVKVKSLSRVQLFVTPWTVAYHTPLSMGFSQQEYWSGLPFPFPEDLPDPGIERESHLLHWQEDSLLPLSHLGSRHWCMPSA